MGNKQEVFWRKRYGRTQIRNHSVNCHPFNREERLDQGAQPYCLEIAILSTEKSGWTKELNLIAWNGKAPKYDIRSWSPDHQKMGKGVTLSAEELSALKAAISDLA